MNQDRFLDYPKTSAILTPRELAVVRLLGSGCSYGKVALRLGISRHTVDSHIKNAYRKLEVHTGAGAVMRAVQLGLLEIAVVLKRFP
jgi:DNA-binding CsgD family transcriptional regulator